MASIISNILDFVSGSSGSASKEGNAEEPLDLLAEPEELDPEIYSKMEPLFPHLQQPGDPVARPVMRRVSFKDSKLYKYDGLAAYACVIDDAFTLKECDELLRIAEDSSEEGWPIAQVNIGNNLQVLDTSYRKSDRILYDDQPLADKLLARIEPLLAKDIAYLDPSEPGTGKGPLGWKGTAAKRRADKFRMTRLNERLRYLKYPVSGFFKMHCDGAYTTPDRAQSSIFTFHLYLNDKTGDVPLKGGSTRFWDYGAQLVQELSPAQLKKRGLSPPPYYDVAPIPGRVLIFQHAFLVHSGEPITAGIKLTIRSDIMYEKVPAEEEEIEYRKHLQRNGLLADEIPVDPKDDVPATEN
ncbi:hypothetical protein H072_10297 [Dactylellina haptotyla CBS 200.50]|uniref:Prolyl 4-hydroxylase alpha subunit domain-containing protein n=1 Tax=Dactylellina haptotyla (strain CBS 200.50) TaxID=1284197 RepID=S8BLM4_DACHA|nr:hypothetical protein H072_10297 [Dactylellina haptotyla CBS 200.50]